MGISRGWSYGKLDARRASTVLKFVYFWFGYDITFSLYVDFIIMQIWFSGNPGCNFEETKCDWTGDEAWKLSYFSLAPFTVGKGTENHGEVEGKLILNSFQSSVTKTNTLTNHKGHKDAVIQSKLEAITCGRHEVRENVRKRVSIGVGFSSGGLKKRGRNRIQWKDERLRNL